MSQHNDFPLCHYYYYYYHQGSRGIWRQKFESENAKSELNPGSHHQQKSCEVLLLLSLLLLLRITTFEKTIPAKLTTMPVMSPLSKRLIATSSERCNAALIRCDIKRFKSMERPSSCTIHTEITTFNVQLT